MYIEECKRCIHRDLCKDTDYLHFIGHCLFFYEVPKSVAYLCKYAKPGDECKHTTNIYDAKNFIEVVSGKFFEKDGTEE